MIPVRDPRNDRRLEISKNVRERFRFGRRRRRQLCADLAWPCLRQHRIPLGRVEVCGDPINNRVGLRDELIARHVAAGHLQRKIRSAIAKQTSIQVTRIANCGHNPDSPTPRSMAARNASFVAVNGSALMNGCTTRGKFSEEKNTPDSTHMGSIVRFINPETPSIVVGRAAISKPNPPKAYAATTTIRVTTPNPPRSGTPNSNRENPSSTTPSMANRTSREITYDPRYSARDIRVATRRFNRL